MANCHADLAFLDPPYNVRIGAVVGRGRTKHSEFAMASGEMLRADTRMTHLTANLSRKHVAQRQEGTDRRDSQ